MIGNEITMNENWVDNFARENKAEDKRMAKEARREAKAERIERRREEKVCNYCGTPTRGRHRVCPDCKHNNKEESRTSHYSKKNPEIIISAEAELEIRQDLITKEKNEIEELRFNNGYLRKKHILFIPREIKFKIEDNENKIIAKTRSLNISLERVNDLELEIKQKKSFEEYNQKSLSEKKAEKLDNLKTEFKGAGIKMIFFGILALVVIILVSIYTWLVLVLMFIGCIVVVKYFINWQDKQAYGTSYKRFQEKNSLQNLIYQNIKRPEQ